MGLLHAQQPCRVSHMRLAKSIALAGLNFMLPVVRFAIAFVIATTSSHWLAYLSLWSPPNDYELRSGFHIFHN